MKAAVLKTVVPKGTVGSNPSLSDYALGASSDTGRRLSSLNSNYDFKKTITALLMCRGISIYCYEVANIASTLGGENMTSGRKRKLRKVKTHKRKKRRKANRHKKKGKKK